MRDLAKAPATRDGAARADVEAVRVKQIWFCIVLLLALTQRAQAISPIAHIHGKIVSIDSKRGTFQIHHDPFPAMPMAMTMEVEPKHRADLKKLRVGETIDATVDTAIVPWRGTDIRPAPAKGKQPRR